MKPVIAALATILLTVSAYAPLTGDDEYPEQPAQCLTPVSSLTSIPRDPEPHGSPRIIGENRPLLTQNCVSKMCFGDGGLSAGQRLAFAALGNRSFAVTEDAARRAAERKINVETIARYGTLKKTHNGTAYVRFGIWEARLSLRNSTIMTVVIW